MKTLIIFLATAISLISCNGNGTLKNEEIKYRFYNKNTGVEYTFLTSPTVQEDIKKGLVVKVDMKDCSQTTFLSHNYSENLPKYNK